MLNHKIHLSINTPWGGTTQTEYEKPCGSTPTSSFCTPTNNYPPNQGGWWGLGKRDIT